MGYVSDLRAAFGSRPLILAAAGALMLDERGRLLLQRRADDGSWDLPGGALELGESAGEAVPRADNTARGVVEGLA